MTLLAWLFLVCAIVALALCYCFLRSADAWRSFYFTLKKHNAFWEDTANKWKENYFQARYQADAWKKLFFQVRADLKAAESVKGKGLLN